MELYPLAAILGFLVGGLVGLTGMGGGSLMMPLLILVLRVSPATAVGTDLAQMMVTKAFGAWQHHRQGSVDYRLSLRLALGSIPGALAGVGILALLQATDAASANQVITRVLGATLVFVSLLLLSRTLLGRHWARAVSLGAGRLAGKLTWLLPAVGLVLGLIVGITSVGGGTLFIVVLLVAFPTMATRRLVGTDIFHALLMTAAAGLAHMGIGNVNLGLTASILMGSIPGVLLGSRLTLYMPARGLRALVAVTLLAVGVRML